MTANAVTVADGVAHAALGKNADFAPPSVTLPAPSNVKAWYLRSFARDILTRAGVQKRLRFCGVKVARGAMGVGVYARPDRGYGRLSGVCVCGQSICCPVCAPRIAAFRAVDVAAAFKFCVEKGFEPRLVTYTLPHTRSDNLGVLIDLLATAWRRNNSSKRGEKLREGIIGNITGAEINFGFDNGWHPHKHQVVFSKPGTFDQERHRAAWLSSLETIGRRSAGTEEHAFRAGEIADATGATYISKLGMAVNAEARATGVSMELAGGVNKGRNIIQLLAAAAGGDEEAGSIWMMGAKEIISRKVTSLRWSRGFRALCGVAPEKSDEEIAAEEVVETDIFLGELNFHQWKIIVNHRAELALCIAANQGRDAVDSMLIGLGAGVLDMERSGPVDTSPTRDAKLLRNVEPKQLSALLKRAEIKREKDRASGISRQQLEAFKVNSL